MNGTAPTVRPPATVAPGVVAPLEPMTPGAPFAPHDGPRFLPARTLGEQRTGRRECVMCGEKLTDPLYRHRVLIVARPSPGSDERQVFTTPHHVCAYHAGDPEIAVIDVCRPEEQALLVAGSREERGWADVVLEVGFADATGRAA